MSQDGSPHGPKTFVLWNPPVRAGGGPGGSGGGGAASRMEARRAKQSAQRRARQEASQDRTTGAGLGAYVRGEELPESMHYWPAADDC